MLQTRDSFRKEIGGKASTRDQNLVEILGILPHTSRAMLATERPGREKPHLKFKRIVLAFYLFSFGCRGNVLHSDLGALIQSVHYLPQGPP